MPELLKRIYIEISNSCNLKCTFCPEVLRKKQFMSVPVFKEILKKIAPYTEEIALHLMGEPLMHRQLDQLLDAAAEKGTPVNITTNGVFLTDEKKQLLLHPIIRQVNFSLQSYSDNFPVRDPGDYLERIADFSITALERRPDLYINFRFWNLNLLNESNLANEEIFAFFEKKLDVVFPVQVDIKFRKSRRLRGRIYVHFDSRFEWPSMQGKYYGTKGTCKALQTHVGILADGRMVPCCLDKEGIISSGNLLDHSFEEIFMNLRNQTMLYGFLSGNLTEELCQRCSYVQRFKGKAKALQDKPSDDRKAFSIDAAVHPEDSTDKMLA